MNAKTRESMNLSPTDTAHLMGMTLSNYQRLENGRDGRAPTKGHLATWRLIEIFHRTGMLPAVVNYIRRGGDFPLCPKMEGEKC